jgi:hypothetical protein
MTSARLLHRFGLLRFRVALFATENLFFLKKPQEFPASGWLVNRRTGFSLNGNVSTI